jgi:DNA topoisomerase-1
MISEYIKQEFGIKYLSSPPRIYRTKSKVAQEAHEAIRPSDVKKTGKSLNIPYDLQRLYDLIWKRTIACQMEDAQVETSTISIDVEKYGFTLTGQKILFPGFLAVHSEKIKEVNLPKLKIGQLLYLKELNIEQKFTDPPARFSEATLIKALEANGIGRPSTYAPILTNIISKKYIEKEGKYLKPTLVGRTLSRLLVDHFPKIVDIQFTAEMEDDLDNIANGERNWLDFLAEFYKDFSKTLEKGNKNIKKEKYLILGQSKEKCPICAKPMEIKLGRFSPFLSCVDFPKCKGMMSLNQREEEKIDTKATDFIEKYKVSPKTDDARDYLLKQSRFGHFWAHPDYPKVKDTKPLELTVS